MDNPLRRAYNLFIIHPLFCRAAWSTPRRAYWPGRSAYMNPVIIWFVLGAALMAAELFTPAFIIVFFGVGAWAAALVAAVWPGLEQELAAFLVVSVLALFLLRRRLVRTFQGRRTEASQSVPSFAYIGRQAEATRPIPAGGEGEIALGGSYWRATSDAAVAEGASVRVLGPVPDDELLIRVEPLAGEPHHRETSAFSPSAPTDHPSA